MDHLEHCAALEFECAKFAEVFVDADPFRPVLTCPAWRVRELGEHLGSVHRWTEHLVRQRAKDRISMNEMDFDRGPITASWMRVGAAELLDTLRKCDPDATMWAWGADQHARFWSRRQLHETLVHRMDLEIALGITPYVDVAVAADAIDEFLVNLPYSSAFSPRIAELVGPGSRLAFAQLDGQKRWVIHVSEEGVSLAPDDDAADVELTATSLDLLLVLYRRRQLGEVDFSLVGDRELLEFWLERSALE